VTEPVTATLGKEAIEQASGLVTRWLDTVQNRHDQIADRIVYEATLVLVSMRAYCNQARLIHVPLQSFSLNWPQERREQLRDAWTRWRSIYDILPALETAHDTLRVREVVLPTRWWSRGDKKDRQAIDGLQAELAVTLAMFLDEVAWRIRRSKIYIKPNDFDVDSQSIIDVSDLVLQVVEHRGQELVGQARFAVVQLREIVLRGRPGLPKAVWQQLDDLAFGG
jgi:hypothetical protein